MTGLHKRKLGVGGLVFYVLLFGALTLFNVIVLEESVVIAVCGFVGWVVFELVLQLLYWSRKE
jgi:hypothetical protein